MSGLLLGISGKSFQRYRPWHRVLFADHARWRGKCITGKFLLVKW